MLNETMKALSDPTRRSILSLLKKSSMSAGEISSNFNMTAATISHHLAKLKEAQLIRETKDKNYIYYSLNASVLEEVMLWLESIKEGK